MGIGNQSRALVTSSKLRGWDPMKIAGGESIENFDKDPGDGNLSGRPLGTLPEGTPDGWPDGMGANVAAPMTTTFDAPDAGRENADRRTSNANPTPGMPGA